MVWEMVSSLRVNKKNELLKSFIIVRYKVRFTQSNFWSQLLLKLNEISDVNQPFYNLKTMAEK